MKIRDVFPKRQPAASEPVASTVSAPPSTKEQLREANVTLQQKRVALAGIVGADPEVMARAEISAAEERVKDLQTQHLREEKERQALIWRARIEALLVRGREVHIEIDEVIRRSKALAREQRAIGVELQTLYNFGSSAATNELFELGNRLSVARANDASLR